MPSQVAISVMKLVAAVASVTHSSFFFDRTNCCYQAIHASVDSLNETCAADHGSRTAGKHPADVLFATDVVHGHLNVI